MATYVFHPSRGKVVEAQKKGRTTHKQSWLDKETGKKFTTDVGAEEYVDQTTGRVLPSYENHVYGSSTNSASQSPTNSGKSKEKQSKENPTKKKTVIKVNNTNIGTIDDDLSLDQSFLLASDYFREISKEKATVQDDQNQKTITFTVDGGRKG